MKRLLSPLPLILACAFILPAPTASAQCVTGSISADFMTEGPNAGEWKYTVVLGWDVQQGLSNVALFCNFGCSDVCAQSVTFDDPSGTGDGVINDDTSVPGDCTVPFSGEFNCNGTPGQGINDPHIKWDALDMPDCEPGTSGSATLCFFTDLPPNPNGEAPVVILKNGLNVCEGMIEGDCPTCPVAVEATNWSKLKGNYRDE
jgi:hypothetical protein